MSVYINFKIFSNHDMWQGCYTFEHVSPNSEIQWHFQSRFTTRKYAWLSCMHYCTMQTPESGTKITLLLIQLKLWFWDVVWWCLVFSDDTLNPRHHLCDTGVNSGVLLLCATNTPGHNSDLFAGASIRTIKEWTTRITLLSKIFVNSWKIIFVHQEKNIFESAKNILHM